MDRLSRDMIVNTFSKLENIDEIYKLCKSNKEMYEICKDREVRNMIKQKLIEKINNFLRTINDNIDLYKTWSEDSTFVGSQAEHCYNVYHYTMENHLNTKLEELLTNIRMDVDLDTINNIGKKFTELRTKYFDFINKSAMN